MIKDLLYVARVIIPHWVRRQRLLKARRGSWRSYLNLTVRFYEISLDKYVAEARYKNGR